MTSPDRFPNLIRCIFKLRELEPPPASVDFDTPSTKLETVLKVFISLATHISNDQSLCRQIRVYWSSGLSTWIMFVFRHIVLIRNRPIHLNATKYFEGSVRSLCKILRLSDEDAKWADRTTPGLLHSIVQGWFLLMDGKHDVLPEWSLVLRGFLQLRPASSPISVSPTTCTLYPENVPLGQVINKNLKRHIRTVRSKPLRCLTDIHLFLMLVSKLSIRPILELKNVLTTIALLCRLADVLLLAKRTCLRNGTVNSRIYRDAHGLILMSFNIILGCIRHPFRLYQLLKHDFMSSIMCADSRYFCLDRFTSSPETKIGHLAAQITHEISTFLVYPFLLRQFIRSRRNVRLTRSTFADEGAEELWNAWSNADRKASALYAVYRRVKSTRTICSCAECPLIRASEEECRQVRYRKCLGCRSAFYCSVACRARDWETDHRSRCSEIAANKKNGFSPIMRNDIRFFAYLLEDHLRHFADEISQQIKPSLDSFNGYEYETVEFPPGNRHPILFIAFDTPALPQAADARVLSQSDVNEWRRTGYFCGSWWLSSVFHRWKDTESTEILVVASFPRAQGVGWPYVTVVNFPLEKDLRFISDIYGDPIVDQ